MDALKRPPGMGKGDRLRRFLRCLKKKISRGGRSVFAAITMAESNPPPTDPKTGSNGSKLESIGQRNRYPNPPEIQNPDAATLRDQWRFAIRQYSKWYSHAWGTAILAGISFFALGWAIKGSNPLPSRQRDSDSPSSSAASTTEREPRP